MKITLPLPPSVNGLFGGGSKQKRFPSKAYKAWKAICPELPKLAINKPVHIHYRFYWPDNRRRDGQSYLKAATDQLVRGGVLIDDNWQIVASESWDHGGVSKPARVDIYIKEIE